MVPHVAARKTHQRLQKYSFITLKRPFHQLSAQSGRPSGSQPEGDGSNHIRDLNLLICTDRSWGTVHTGRAPYIESSAIVWSMQSRISMPSSTFPKFESYRSVTTTNNNRHSGARVTREARDKRARNPYHRRGYGFRACAPTGYRRQEHIPE